MVSPTERIYNGNKPTFTLAERDYSLLAFLAKSAALCGSETARGGGWSSLPEERCLVNHLETEFSTVHTNQATAHLTLETNLADSFGYRFWVS